MALEDLDAAVFGLNNGLQVENVNDGTHSSLAWVRSAADSTVRVIAGSMVRKGSRRVRRH